MANVSQLQPALTPQVQTSSSKSSEKDADFLALRLLNKRARLRLSPLPLDLTSLPGKASLFATANSKGWFAAVTRDDDGASALILSPLSDLRTALVTASGEDEQSYRPQRRVQINGATPQMLIFASNDTRILLGLVDGSIQVYASDQLLFSGDGPVQPIHVFATSSSAALLSIHPNPGDIPELVAVLRDCTNSPGSLAVELFDVQKLISSGGWMAGKSPSTTPTSVSWSPKGKQLALGLQSGDIVTFSPSATATPKSSIPHPPSANNTSVISVHWLSTSSFYTIYAPPGQLAPDVEQIHFLVSLDSKSNSAQDLKFDNPYLPFPGLRPPGEFLVCLRGWDPSKILLFIGDSTSSDIGLIGSVAEDSGERWLNLTLEETSTPSLPLDKDQNDTILLGMDIDLTSSDSYHHSTASGEALELPAHPIMYVYASDGTILGWHVLNVTGARYPGISTASNTSTPSLTVPSIPSSIVRESSSDMQTTPTISPTTSAPAEASAINAPATAFGQPSTFGAQGSAFGQTSTFGQTQSGFSQQPTSVFGQASSFGQSATTPAFGSTSTQALFGQPSKPAFGSTSSMGGFGSFSSTGPAKFGQPTFAFSGPPQAPTTLPSSTSVPEESMAADDAPSLGGLGLGMANSQDADSKPSIFGNTNVTASSGQGSSDGGLIKPGTGFAAFAGFDQKSPFAKPSAFPSTQQSTASFGFGAFASGTQSAFATAASKGGPAAKPVWAMGDSSKQAESSPLGGTTTLFGKPAESPEPKTPSAIPSKTTDTSTTPSPFTSTPAFSMSAQFLARDSIARDDDSRSPSPAPVTPKATTSSTFSGSIPGPSTGAFSNLQTTPSAFVKPGSGVFGELSKDSPFFAPKPLESKPVSVFALSAMPGTPASTPPKASSAQPTFGMSSMPAAELQGADPKPTIFGKTSLPVPSGQQTTSASVIKPGTGFGAFASFDQQKPSAFSNTQQSTTTFGFGAFASGAQSAFAAAASKGGSAAKPVWAVGDSSKPAESSLSGVTTNTFGKPAESPEQKTPLAIPSKTADSQLVAGDDANKSPSPVPLPPKATGSSIFMSSTPGPTSGAFSGLQTTPSAFAKPTSGIFGELPKDSPFSTPKPPESKPVSVFAPPATPTTPASTPPKVSIAQPTLGASSVPGAESQDGPAVSVSAPSSPSTAPQKAPVRDHSTTPPVSPVEDGEDDGPESPIEESESEVTESPVEETDDEAVESLVEESEDEGAGSVSPFARTSSPSTAPQGSPVRDHSTTPPGSPVKDTASVPMQIPTPPLKVSPPPTSPFALAPRSNNRPARSSPLASTPIVLEDEVEKPPAISKSAPPPTVVSQPAAPKTPFGQWTPSPPPLAHPTDADPARSKTPPVVSLSPALGEKPASSLFKPATAPVSAPFFAPAQNVATTIAASTPGPLASVFSLPASFPSFTSTGSMPSAWGTPSSTPPLPKPPVPAPTPSPTPEQGMQAECTLLLSTLGKEMENLKKLATAASLKVGELKKTSGVAHQKADLGDPRKWVLGDIEEYGRLLVDVQGDVKELKLQRLSLCLKELDSNMLKVNTRKEEIVRFNKAKTDAEFAKMLKIRTLAPEYSETQSQLRKKIRAIRDRVQKLEDHLQASKKRINELRTGRPSIRPPSLDTVNRTLRNIDIAIDQQKREMSQLRHRMTRLDISGGASTRDQLAVSSSKRPLNVTPNVAITTAAALNAERFAQRLKKAMLASRTQPLLNTTATASPVPTSFQTPQRPTVVKSEVKTPDGVFAPPTTPTPKMIFPSSLPGWTPSPSSEFGSPASVSHDITPSRSRGGTKHHQKPIVLRKSVSPAAPTQSLPFEWQPVEPIKPASSLPFSLRPPGSS